MVCIFKGFVSRKALGSIANRFQGVKAREDTHGQMYSSRVTGSMSQIIQFDSTVSCIRRYIRVFRGTLKYYISRFHCLLKVSGSYHS
jgi:hypothetical protein